MRVAREHAERRQPPRPIDRRRRVLERRELVIELGQGETG
jgi:hypothetical protein